MSGISYLAVHSLDTTPSESDRPAFSLTLGPILAGCCIQLILFGIGSMQAYLYFWNYNTDSARMRAMVVGLWILGAVDVVMGSAALWRLFIDQWLSQHALQQPLWLTIMQGLLATTMTCSVQLYLCRRVWCFATGKKRIVPVALAVLAIWPLVGLTWIFIRMFSHTVFSFYLSPGYETILSVWVVSTFVDTCLAINLIVLLAPYRTGFSSTRRIIHRLQILIINTNLFTALISISTLVLFLTRRFTLDLLATYIPTGSAYFCCLLTNLNARSFVRGEDGMIVATDTEVVLESDVVFAPCHGSANSADELPTISDLARK